MPLLIITKRDFGPMLIAERCVSLSLQHASFKPCLLTFVDIFIEKHKYTNGLMVETMPAEKEELVTEATNHAKTPPKRLGICLFQLFCWFSLFSIY